MGNDRILRPGPRAASPVSPGSSSLSTKALGRPKKVTDPAWPQFPTNAAMCQPFFPAKSARIGSPRSTGTRSHSSRMLFERCRALFLAARDFVRAEARKLRGYLRVAVRTNGSLSALAIPVRGIDSRCYPGTLNLKPRNGRSPSLGTFHAQPVHAGPDFRTVMEILSPTSRSRGFSPVSGNTSGHW